MQNCPPGKPRRVLRLGGGLDNVVQIYALCDPDGSIRYVGKARDARARLKQHMRETRRRTPVYLWIESLRRHGLTPALKVLEECSECVWPEREMAHIATHRVNGRLLNVADGGDQPSCPRHVRAQNGRSNARLVHGDAMRRHIWDLKRRLGLAIRGGYLTETARAKLRAAAASAPHLFGEWANL